MGGPSVLVTGATGFIGRWSVPELLRRGYEVHAVGAARRTVPSELAGASFHAADLLDTAAVSHLIDELRASHLVHFAWYTVPGAYWTALDNFSWVAASLHLVRRFHVAGGRRAVIAGTCAEYDWSQARVCDEGSTPLVFEASTDATPYAICKASLQRILASYARTAGLSLAWGRIFLQYGPYEPATRLVSSVICALLRGESAACSPGTQIRNFLYSQDVGEAFAALLDGEVEGPVNIGADGELSIADLVKTIGRLIGRPELIALGAKPMAPNEPPYLVPDVSRLRREVGWQPAFDLEAGLRRTIDWWRDHRP
jgi:nucleoside-diphosphate-sugar epimerase